MHGEFTFALRNIAVPTLAHPSGQMFAGNFGQCAGERGRVIGDRDVVKFAAPSLKDYLRVAPLDGLDLSRDAGDRNDVELS